MSWRPHVVTVVIVGLATTGGALAADVRLPVIPGSRSGRPGSQPLVRPASIVYSGDGSGALGGFDGTGRDHYGHLRWTTWTNDVGLGRGANWIDNCTPDCAVGRFSPEPATVTVFRPRGGHFTRLRIRTRQGGRTSSYTVAIVGTGGHLIYQTLLRR